jgi:replicative DNA helicase
MEDSAYQRFLTYQLTHDAEFLEEFSEILPVNAFDNPDIAWLYDKAIAHYRESGQPISEGALTVLMEEADHKRVDLEMVQLIWDLALEPKDGERDFIFRHTRKFIKKHKLGSLMSEAYDISHRGEVDRAIARVDAGLSEIAAIDDEEEIFDELDGIESFHQDLREEYLDPETGEVRGIKLGLFTVDQQMKGGLRKGQLGIFMAPPGQGKSHALIFAGREAAKAGFNVVFFTLEMSKLQIQERFWSEIVDMDSAEIPNNLVEFEKAVAREAKRMLKNGAGAFIVESFPTKTATVRMLKAFVKKAERKYGRIDLVVVDYADILRSDRKTERRVDEQAAIYEDLRGLAGELQVPIWTASQANRKAFGRKHVDMTYIADSWDKVKVADYIIAITRPKNAPAERVFWQFIKSRNTQPEGIVKLHQDLSRSAFEDLGYDDGSEDTDSRPEGGADEP